MNLNQFENYTGEAIIDFFDKHTYSKLLSQINTFKKKLIKENAFGSYDKSSIVIMI